MPCNSLMPRQLGRSDYCRGMTGSLYSCQAHGRVPTRHPDTVRHFLFLVALASSVVSVGGQAPAPDILNLRILVVESEEDARLVQTRLARGDDFAALAEAMSVDPTAPEGGMLGAIDVATLRPELREALRGLRAGDLSPIVRVPLGFAILEVMDGDVPAATSTVGLMGLTSEGSVKFVIDVAGFAAASVATKLFSSLDSWNRNAVAACQQRPPTVDKAIDALRQDFGTLTPSQIAVSPEEITHGVAALAQLYVYRGDMDEAIREYERAYTIAVQHQSKSAIELEEMLGIAYLHRAEMINGIYHEPGDRCLLSHDGLPAFAKTADVDKAIEHFSRYLAEKPEDLEVRWLLNLAHMAAGGYPHKVPPAQLVPMYRFTKGGDVGRFRDVAVQAGVSSFAAAGGVVVDDFDGDGRADIMTSSLEPCAPLRFFHNNGNGTFTDRAAPAGLSEQLGGLNIVQADYNNDGHLDLLVLRGGWEIPQQKSLLRNNGDGTFADVTQASGLAGRVTATQTAVWADIDNDGFLDLFLGNENTSAQLFRNRGDGTFEDIARGAGVARTTFAKGVTAGDYDGDGWMDLYVSNSGGTNLLFRNNRNRTFTETARAAGVPGPGFGFTTWFFDYDNDGWQDLFVSSYYTSVDETARTFLELPNNAPPMKLYRNAGDGTFRDVSAAVGLKVYMPMGSNFGDIDNDGFLDIYQGTGNPSYGALTPSVLLHNRQGQAFVDVTASSGTGELHKGHGVAFADLDNDGDDEIVFEVGGATPGDRHALRLFENPGHGNDWLNLKLTGTRTNRGAIGARIAVTVTDSTGSTRTIHRVVTSGGSFGASPLQQHVGLGRGARTVDVEIWWPVSGTRQRFAGISPNQTLAVTELSDTYVRLDRPRVRLGGTQ